ncbi:glycosyltransferase family 4 protein [Terrilactibacillus laevilacticus]|uniref:Glycosyltransferase family 4 protein n=1 Tax=Terrilactibacillus laevilacticus TaxID=1380157 RepID=A0ABW5PS96_9BACI|nr:glycosyltransferase family 4 protein [Terrilactibacillus laevilacticus]
MNIGIFTDTYYPQVSGVSTSTMILKKELEKLGHCVYIFTSSDSNADLIQEKGRVFRFTSFSALIVPERRLAISGFIRATQLAQRLQLDIIHTQTEFSMGLIGKHVAKKCQIPLIHTYHTMYEDYLHYIANGWIITPKLVEKLTCLFCKQAQTIIAPSEKVSKKLRTYGVQNQIKIVPTGIDFSVFQASSDQVEKQRLLRKQIGLKLDDIVILSIGRLAEEKNIETIIRAMPEVKKKYRKAKLVIVGDGPARSKLERLTRILHIQDIVFFVGEKEWKDIPAYYHLGDVFVSASTSETQGLTYIEAMASEIPVIAKKDSSITHLIETQVTGFLFNEDDRLAQAIIKTLDARQNWSSIVKRAKLRIHSLSAEQFGRHIESIYLNSQNQELSPSQPLLRKTINGIPAIHSLTKLKGKWLRRESRHHD